MRFKIIDKNNIMLATKIQLEIFGSNSECAYLHYLNSFISKKDYFLVEDKNKIVGISGLYIDEFTQEDGVIWLGWFGVLPEFRCLGYGQKILEKTIELAKKRKKKILRLYTSTDNTNARKLYDKIMDICQPYDIEKEKCMIYSKSLNDEKVKEFENNQYLGIDFHDEEQKEGYKMYLRRLNENRN